MDVGGRVDGAAGNLGIVKGAQESGGDDSPVRQDIRLLGRLLGETVRDTEGDDLYQVVEDVRRLAIRFRRDGDAEARAQLATRLDALDLEAAISVVRAFSYFSHLANIAEDQDKNRRFRHDRRAGVAPQDGSLAVALRRLKASGVTAGTLRGVVARALICPVLTAHPTEVQRRSTLDRQLAIARLLADRSKTALSADEEAGSEQALRLQIDLLWQSRMLRFYKPTVHDEVENSLAYHRTTFLSEVPHVHADFEDLLERELPASEPWQLPPLLRLGSWIGGDRDGNPFVDQEVLKYAVRRQSQLVLEHYLEQTARGRVRAPRRHARKARRADAHAAPRGDGRALCAAGGAHRRPRDDERFARRARRRPHRARPPAHAPARGAGVPVPPRGARPAPDVRRARAGRRRAVRARRRVARLPRVARGGARGAPRRGALDPAAPRVSISRLLAGDRGRAGHRARRQRGA